jgi:hypothetical protein
MLALADRGDYAAYVLAVLDDGVADSKIAECDFVSDGDVLMDYGTKFAVILRDDTQHFSSGRQVLDYDHAHIVAVVVHQEVRSDFHDFAPIRQDSVFHKI